MARAFRQVDVFSEVPFGGNPVAVVLDGEGLSGEEMQRFARWTNLSETTFVLPPGDPSADYRVRIFTPSEELPFAGHPTLGTAHAWGAGETAVQECGAGLVEIRRTEHGLAFAAPPRRRSGPVEDAVVDEIVAGLGIRRSDVVAAEWGVNGPEWAMVLLGSAEAVLALRPRGLERDVGVAALHGSGLEVRAFFPKDGETVEDPVTGSLNAALAQWLLALGRVTAPYVARQGTALGRAGRVHVSSDPDGAVWVGGATVTRVSGTVDL